MAKELRIAVIGIVAVVGCLLWSVTGYADSGPVPASADDMPAVLQDWSAELSLKLNYLVVSHPSDEVSETLHYWIANQYVLLAFQSIPSLQGGTVSTIEVVDYQGSLMPVLVIDPEFFQFYEQPVQYLIIYHEYLHLVKLFSGEAALESFFAQPADAVSWSEVWELYLAELECYFRECELAIQNNWQNYISLCQLLPDCRKFRLEVASLMAQSPSLEPFRQQLNAAADTCSFFCQPTN